MIKTVFDKNILVTAAKTGPVSGEAMWLKQKGSEVMKSLQQHFLFLCVNQSMKAQSLLSSVQAPSVGYKK